MIENNTNNNTDVALLMQTIQSQTDAQTKYSHAFVDIITELNKNQHLLNKILELSEKSQLDYSEIKKEVALNKDFNQNMIDSVLELVHDNMEQDKKSQNVLEKMAFQLLEIYNGRLGTKEAWKNSLFYAGAVITVLAIFEALIQFGLLHFSWGH